MIIYKNRYQANKVKRSDEVVVKVCDGYVIMSQSDYRVWKKQK